jgi:hypothetical protein
MTGEQELVPIPQEAKTHFLSFSPDGRWLCLSRFKGTSLIVCDGFTGSVVTNLPTGTENFAFTSAGDTLI